MCALTDTPDRSVDAVVSYMALMDSPNLDGALAELHRILVDRGDLYISILHPCFTNGGYAWLRTSKSARLRLVVSGYFDQRPWMNVWRLSHGPDDPAVPYEFPRFPRTLANYVNAIVIVRAGLTVVSMSEPRPTERTCRRLPELRRWRTCRLVLAHSREEGRLNGKADEGDC